MSGTQASRSQSAGRSGKRRLPIWRVDDAMSGQLISGRVKLHSTRVLGKDTHSAAKEVSKDNMLSMSLNGVAESGHVATVSSMGEHALHGPAACLRRPQDRIRPTRPALLRTSSPWATAGSDTHPRRSASPRTSALIRCLDRPRRERLALHAMVAPPVRMGFSRSHLKLSEPARREFARNAELHRDVAGLSRRRHQLPAMPSSGAFSAGRAGRTRPDNCQEFLDQPPSLRRMPLRGAPTSAECRR
jgi:hypothetical protein